MSTKDLMHELVSIYNDISEADGNMFMARRELDDLSARIRDAKQTVSKLIELVNRIGVEVITHDDDDKYVGAHWSKEMPEIKG